jgi:hypothetical protein
VYPGGCGARRSRSACLFDMAEGGDGREKTEEEEKGIHNFCSCIRVSNQNRVHAVLLFCNRLSCSRRLPVTPSQAVL